MQNLVITNKGQELMAKLIAGTSTAEFTKICTSDYDYSGAVLEDLTDLYQIKQTTMVSKVTRTDTKTVEILGAMNNSEISTGYYIRVVGLYVKDSDVEILYAVSINENPDYMPPFNGRTVSGVTFRLNTKVDNSEQVALEVNPAAIPTIEQLNQAVNSIENKADKSKSAPVTLTYTEWTGETAPYSYTISGTDITATNMIDITFRSGVTKEVTDAWDAAEIKRYIQSDGELILYADGEKPTIDIPLNMIIRGDV